MRNCLSALSAFAGVFVLCLCLVFPARAQSTQVQIVTGDYPPFSSEELPGQGLISELVTASFREQGVNAELRFMPWQRGFVETRNALHVATFPYVKNDERTRDFWYSAPLYPDYVRLFVRSDTVTPVDWADKAICVPQGYNMARVGPFIEERQARLERPPDMLNCFQMLQRGRVFAVWSSENVADYTTRGMRRDGFRYKSVAAGVEYAVDLHLIISRQLPLAQLWLERFNNGFAKIQKNGVYAQIIARHALASSAR